MKDLSYVVATPPTPPLPPPPTPPTPRRRSPAGTPTPPVVPSGPGWPGASSITWLMETSEQHRRIYDPEKGYGWEVTFRALCPHQVETIWTGVWWLNPHRPDEVTVECKC